jgi:TPR repeat protein
MHVQGPPTVEQNLSKGLAWLEKAAALGDLHAKYNTGFMLTQGVGGEDRMEEGLAWFEEAAVDGDAKSAFALAAMYLGQGEAFGMKTTLGF